jgi:hypothetical protein
VASNISKHGRSGCDVVIRWYQAKIRRGEVSCFMESSLLSTTLGKESCLALSVLNDTALLIQTPLGLLTIANHSHLRHRQWARNFRAKGPTYSLGLALTSDVYLNVVAILSIFQV